MNELEDLQPENVIESEEEIPVNEPVAKKSYATLLSSLAFALLLSALIFYFYSWPHYQTYQQNLEAINRKQNTITSKTARLSVLKTEALNREPDEEELVLLRSIPTGSDVPNLIRELDQLSKLAQGDNLDDTELKSFSIGQPFQVAGKNYQALNITGSFSSFAFSLPKLLQELEKDSHRLYNVKSLNISFDKRSTESTDLLGGTLDQEYNTLLLKRANFLLDDTSAKRLEELQYQIFDTYQKLLHKNTRSEQEEKTFQKLKTEVEKIKNERNYSLTMETYNT